MITDIEGDRACPVILTKDFAAHLVEDVGYTMESIEDEGWVLQHPDSDWHPERLDVINAEHENWCEIRDRLQSLITRHAVARQGVSVCTIRVPIMNLDEK